MHAWYVLLRLLLAVSPLVLVLLSSAPSVSASPAPPHSANAISVATLSIQPASRLAVPGQVFTLTLSINGATNAAAFETTVSYDPNILQVLAITHPAPSFFAVNGRTAGRPPAEPLVNFALGRMTMGEYSFGGSPVGRSGNGTLAYLRFQALVLGATFLRFSHDAAFPTELLDPYGNPLYSSTTDGLVQVVPEQHLYLPLIRR